MRLPVMPFVLHFSPGCCVGTAQRVPHQRRYNMQKLTRVTLSTGEMAIYLDGWYLTSTEADEHAQGLDDVVTTVNRWPG